MGVKLQEYLWVPSMVGHQAVTLGGGQQQALVLLGNDKHQELKGTGRSGGQQ